MATTSAPRRRQGEGSIIKLDDNKWRVMYQMPPQGGKRQRKTAVVYSEKEAVAKLNEFKVEASKGQLVATSSLKFKEFAQRWLETKKPPQTKQSTYNSYESTLMVSVYPFFGDVGIQRLTTAKINDYIRHKLQEGLSGATVSRHKAIIHGILELAVAEGIVGKNAAANSMAIRIEEKETRALTQEEANRLLKVAREDFEKHKGHGNHFFLLYHFLLLAMTTGMRRGEIMGLKWSKIDFEGHTIRVDENLVELIGGAEVGTPKSKKSRRVIPVDAWVLEKLKELKKVYKVKTEYVFSTRKGEYVTPGNINRAFKKLLKRVGVEDVRIHDLRHTYATLLVSQGYDIKNVSELLGHEDARLLIKRYAHGVSEVQRSAAGSIAVMLGDHDISE